MTTFHIHITGLVQGVGFRPFVYKLALQWKLNGWVKNTTDGVHIRFNSNHQEADSFLNEIVEKAPALSIISSNKMIEVAPEHFENFEIIHSESSAKANLLLTPDFAICPDCENELNDQKNRRNSYPFITCTNCGPRYSIIQGLPYDRVLTTMDSFIMCEQCLSEYENPLDRRYYSQTNSCPECAVKMKIFQICEDKKIQQLEEDIASKQIGIIVESLDKGMIVAIKGIGGFLLMADASSDETVEKLRNRKNRPTKAFAIMYPDLETLEKDAYVNNKARKLYQGPVSPIILLARKKDAKIKISPKVAPGLDKMGVMLPYTPLFKMIIDGFGKAVIATSGNFSNQPIVFRNEEALEKLSIFADLIVINNRDIVLPQDDSVIAFTSLNERKIMLRRSRGLAPGYFDPEIKLPKETILAFGADMKSSFCLAFNGIPFVSQYLGDLGDFGTQTAFSHTLNHLLDLFKAMPEVLLHDHHPNYFSSILSEELYDKKTMKKKEVQHHEAHFAAIMGEHHLFSSQERILGVIWDGTGLGMDGHIWGGEFFAYENAKINRLSHLDYFDFILGDKMPREPRISALSLGRGIEEIKDHLCDKFTDSEWNLYARYLEDNIELQTSSVGRLFDAVSSILLGCDIMSYEGEAAMYLEVEALDYAKKTFYKDYSPYKNVFKEDGKLSPHKLIMSILADKNRGIDKSEIAYKFHCSLIYWIERVLKHEEYKYICFSGGVFQNGLLLDLIQLKLAAKFDLFFHERLSPNDECISFGQLMHYLHIEE